MRNGPSIECHTHNSEDPAVEADCPDECEGGSHDEHGTMKYHCNCEASSAEECAEKYPGEQPRSMQRMPRQALTLRQPCKPESLASPRHTPRLRSCRKASFVL